jgi:hypothetical protein
MGLVQVTVKAVYCPALEAYTPIEGCRTCKNNEGWAFAKDEDHHNFGVICGRSIDGYIPEKVHRHDSHWWPGRDESWQ